MAEKEVKKLNVLFVSHDASRTGAPIVFLHILRWLKDHANIEITILLKYGGELSAEFQAIAPTYHYNYSFPQNILERGFKKIRNKLVSAKENKKIPAEIINNTFDLVYLNTVASLDLAPLLKGHFKCPVIVHIHENEFTIQCYYPDSLSDINKKAIDHFIAVSNSTQDSLLKNSQIPNDKVSLIYECIDIDKVRKPNANKKPGIRQELSLEKEFIVGGSGLTSWRKGVDLFVQLGVLLNQIRPENNIKLLWIGAVSRDFKQQFLYESKRLGVHNKVIFAGSKTNPEDYFQLFDVFSLTSREDPFPLVVLEAAAQAKPIICFDNAGGIPELIIDGGGVIIPYGDVDAMARSILKLYDNPVITKELGAEAEKMVQQFDRQVIGRQVMEVINQVFSKI